MVAPSGVEVVVYRGVGDLPHFNPDLDGDAPPTTVAELRRRIGCATAWSSAARNMPTGSPGR